MRFLWNLPAEYRDRLFGHRKIQRHTGTLNRRADYRFEHEQQLRPGRAGLRVVLACSCSLLYFLAARCGMNTGLAVTVGGTGSYRRVKMLVLKMTIRRGT